MNSKADINFMRRALRLALLGEGFTSPNPMVGDVVVAPDGRIIGEGYHRKFGGPHAEVNAIASVGEADRALLPESTVYVTLEPCSHYGKTPPCASLLIRTGVRRVVIGSLDPFAEVNGRGVSMLRDAGIEVTVGVLEEECRRLNERFMTANTLGRPWIQLKWAQSADGFIAAFDEKGEKVPVAISSPVGKVWMHRERALADAILVGVDTVIADDSRLDCRLWPGREPLKVTFDSDRLPADARILKGRHWLIPKGTSLSDAMTRLHEEFKVNSIMVEGGAATLNGFLKDNLWDEIRVEVSDIRICCGVKAPDTGIAARLLHPGIHTFDKTDLK